MFAKIKDHPVPFATRYSPGCTAAGRRAARNRKDIGGKALTGGNPHPGCLHLYHTSFLILASQTLAMISGQGGAGTWGRCKQAKSRRSGGSNLEVGRKCISCLVKVQSPGQEVGTQFSKSCCTIGRVQGFCA